MRAYALIATHTAKLLAGFSRVNFAHFPSAFFILSTFDFTTYWQ